MKNENDIIIHRFEDLAERSLCNYTPTYTDFLDMNEQSILSSSYLPCSFTLYGGYEMAERKIACFNEEELTGEAPDFPAVWLKISPTAPKFANELSHRDFLGALMNLGLERCVFGDLIIFKVSSVSFGSYLRLASSHFRMCIHIEFIIFSDVFD